MIYSIVGGENQTMPTREDYRKCMYVADTPACFRAQWTDAEKTRLSSAVKKGWKQSAMTDKDAYKKAITVSLLSFLSVAVANTLYYWYLSKKP